MNKKSILLVVGLIVVVCVLSLLLGNLNQYHDNSGEITPTEGNVNFTYNNDKNNAIYWKWNNGSTAPVYNEYKNLTGTVTIDLNAIAWDKDYEPDSSDNHRKGSANAEYAEEHVVEDITNNINNSNLEQIKSSDKLNFTYNLEYYDQNDSLVTVKDYSAVLSEDDIIKNITLDGSKLKIDLYKNYQLNATEKVDNSTSNTNTVLEQSDINNINHAILRLKFEGIENQYQIKIILNEGVFNSSHM